MGTSNRDHGPGRGTSVSVGNAQVTLLLTESVADKSSIPRRGFQHLMFSAVLLIGAAAALTTTGCYRPLLSPDEERSQYDRYDAIRAQRAPAFIEDEFGRRRPNLRGRLLERQ